MRGEELFWELSAGFAVSYLVLFVIIFLLRRITSGIDLDEFGTLLFTKVFYGTEFSASVMLVLTFFVPEFVKVIIEVKQFLLIAGLLGAAHGFVGFFRGI